MGHAFCTACNLHAPEFLPHWENDMWGAKPWGLEPQLSLYSFQSWGIHLNRTKVGGVSSPFCWINFSFELKATEPVMISFSHMGHRSDRYILIQRDTLESILDISVGTVADRPMSRASQVHIKIPRHLSTQFVLGENSSNKQSIPKHNSKGTHIKIKQISRKYRDAMLL